MMTRWSPLALVFAVACGGASPRPAAEAATPPAPSPAAPAAGAHQEQIAQIDAFLADPANVVPTSAVEFTMSSSEVQVVIPGALADLTAGVDEQTQAVLIWGFLLGNARAQLVSGVAQDDFVAGLRGMLRVYQALGASVPGLDEAQAQERAGTLEAWAQDWRERHPAAADE